MNAEVKPGYMRTDAGVIPSDWQVVTIGDVASFSGGAQPPRETFIFDPKPGYIRLIQIRDYKSNDFVTYIPFSLAKKTCTSEDVMIGRYGPPIFQILRGLEGSYNVALIKTIPSSKLDREFWYYLLVQERLFKYIDLLSRRSSGQTGVEMPALKAYHIPLPPMKEQQAISSALKDVDALISGLDQLISKKRDIQQAAMQQLLTGQLRLPGFSGEWEVKRLGEIGEISGAGVDKKIRTEETEVKLLNYTDVYKKDFLRSSDFSHVVTAKPEQISRCGIKKCDVFFTPTSETRDDIGHAAVSCEDMPGIVYSYHVVRLRPTMELNTEFLGFVFKSKAFKDQASTLCEGSGTRYVITLPKFRAMNIFLPSDVSEQAAIGGILFEMSRELLALEARRDKARMLKQGMMQELLTGRIRLTNQGI